MSADFPTRGIPHRNKKQRNGIVRGICQYGTCHSRGSLRRHQPVNGKQHPDLTSVAVLQPHIHQGGGKHVTADIHEEPPGRTQKPKGRNIQHQEASPLRRCRRRQQGQQKNGTQLEKRRTVPPPHLMEHHVLLEPWSGRPSRSRVKEQ